MCQTGADHIILEPSCGYCKKKDDEIRLAKSEYSETVQKIAELEVILAGTRKPRPGQSWRSRQTQDC